MLKAKKNSMYIDVTGVDDMTDRRTLMEEIIRRNCDVDPRIIKSLVNKLDRCGDENHMKKLFISAPMKGRTETQIRATMEQMHHIAEAVFGEELEVIQTYISDDPPADANQAVWYLGESIKKMADADYFIGIYDEEKAFRGCAIENLVARSYNIPSYVINFGFVAPDVTEARAKANRKYNSYY